MLDREEWPRIPILTKKWRRRWREWRIVKKRKTQVGKDYRALFKHTFVYGTSGLNLALRTQPSSFYSLGAVL